MKNWIMIELAEWRPIRPDTDRLLGYIDNFVASGHKSLASRVDQCLWPIDIGKINTGIPEKRALAQFLLVIVHDNENDMYLTHMGKKIKDYNLDIEGCVIRWDYDDGACSYGRGEILKDVILYAEGNNG